MTTHDDQTRDADGHDDDDLLSTIRQMVNEEAARDTVEHPGHLAPGADSPLSAYKDKDADPNKPAPLVLGALTRVADAPAPEPEEVPDNVTPFGVRFDAMDPEVRGAIADIVREELLHAFDTGLEDRLRRMVREELKDYLARARRTR